MKYNIEGGGEVKTFSRLINPRANLVMIFVPKDKITNMFFNVKKLFNK